MLNWLAINIARVEKPHYLRLVRLDLVSVAN